jgi:hypothetical protein
MELDYNQDSIEITDETDIGKHLRGELPADLLMTPLEYRKLIGKKPKSSTLKLPDVPRYIGRDLELYAQEDDLDQPICIFAKKRNIDILILTHMVGSSQVVTEILDTRDRTDSFKSLLYVVD